MYKISIIEDDIKLRNELRRFLEPNGYQCLVIESFENVLSWVVDNTADLILLDINLPDIDGKFLCKEIRKLQNTPIIMVTSQNTEVDELISMSYGADDFITKPYNPQILLLRIEAILKRAKGHANTISYQDIILTISKSSIERKGKCIILSRNELTIFSYLLQNRGKIVSRDEMINHLWNQEAFIDDNTLTVNITRLRVKISEIGLDNVIETRRGQGYIIL